jgi:tetratricopeptide (TPR) repeat protein
VANLRHALRLATQLAMPSKMLSQMHPETTDPILQSDWYPKASAGLADTQRLDATGLDDDDAQACTNLWLPPVTRHYTKEASITNRGGFKGSPRRGQAGLAATREWAPVLPEVSSARGARVPTVPTAPNPKTNGGSRRTRLVEHSRRELTEAKAAIKRGENLQAASKLNNLIEQYPKSAPLRTLRSQALLAEGNGRQRDAAKVEENLRRLQLNSSPRKSDVRDLGQQLQDFEEAAEHHWQDALSDAKRAILLSKDESAKASYLAGRAATKLGLPDEAVAFLQACLRHNPTDERCLRAFEQCAIASARSRPYRAHGDYAYNPVQALCPHTSRVLNNRVPTFRPDLPDTDEVANQYGYHRPKAYKQAQPPRQPMDESWRTIDLSDIVYEQTVVHEAIVGALADGSVSADEAYVIDIKLKQAEVSPSLRAHIAEVLKGNEPEEEANSDEPDPGAEAAQAIKSAAKAGDAAKVKALLAEGVSVDVQDESGYTPLYHATMYNHQKVVALCISSGATVDMENNNGVSPLMAAARDGVTAIVKMLLEAGADAYQVDEFGRTASSVAAEKGFDETSKFVEEWVQAHPKGSHKSLIVKKPSAGGGGGGTGGGAGGGDGASGDILETLKSICPPGFHRREHGAQRVYAQPLVQSTLKAALIGAKAPWQPEKPGYVDDAKLKLLGVPPHTRSLLIRAMTDSDSKLTPHGLVLRAQDEAELRYLCSTYIDVVDLLAVAKIVIGVDNSVLTAKRLEKRALLGEIFIHRTASLSKDGGAVGVYGEPSQEEYEEPLGLFACGCSIQACKQCTTACDDWDRILCDLDENHGMYKTMFRIYGVAADRTSEREDSEMNARQFHEFASKCGVMDHSEGSAALISRIHLRASHDHARVGKSWINFYDRRFMHPSHMREERVRIIKELEDKAEEARARGERPADQDAFESGQGIATKVRVALPESEFMAALIRCAHAKYHDEPSLHLRWLRFVEEDLPKKEDLMADVEDEIDQVMAWQPVEDVLLKHHSVLGGLFLHYCAADFAGETALAPQLINETEWGVFLKESGLVGPKLTALEGKKIFVKLNLDDDLSKQDHEEDSSSELVFNEFAECVVRVATEVRDIDGVPLWRWISKTIQGGDVWKHEEEMVAIELHDFLSKMLGQFSDQVLGDDTKTLFERKELMTWHQLQLESGEKAKTAVRAMKALAVEYCDVHGTVDVGAARGLWKQCLARIGLVACPPVKVFREFLAAWH